MLIPPTNRASLSAEQRGREVLVDLVSVRVAVLVRGRNAWHSTWVKHYTQGAALYTDLASAQGAAEWQRGPGNVFYAYEAPALVVRSPIRDYVVTDLHPADPMSRYEGCKPAAEGGALYPGASAGGALASFDSFWGPLLGYWSGPDPSEHSLVSGQVMNPSALKPLQGSSLLNSQSFAQGSQYRLGWTSMRTRYTRRGVNAVERSFARQLDGDPPYREALHIVRERFVQVGSSSSVSSDRTRTRAWACKPILELLATRAE